MLCECSFKHSCNFSWVLFVHNEYYTTYLNSYLDKDLTPHSFTCWKYSSSILSDLHIIFLTPHLCSFTFPHISMPPRIANLIALLHSKNRSTPHQTTLTLPSPFSFSSLAAQECSWVCIYVHPRRKQRCMGNLLRAGSGVNSFFARGLSRIETRTNSGWLYILFFIFAVSFKLSISNSIQKSNVYCKAFYPPCSHPVCLINVTDMKWHTYSWKRFKTWMYFYCQNHKNLFGHVLHFCVEEKP